MLALRRRYPQVYHSKDKLLLDLSQINVERRDFDQAVQRLVPASQRSATASGKPLSSIVSPLLQTQLQQLIKATQHIFPEGMSTLKLKGELLILLLFELGLILSRDYPLILNRTVERHQKANEQPNLPSSTGGW